MDLGDRMKAYEKAHRYVLSPRTPIIVRVDGKAFHTYTRGASKPFDDGLMYAMDACALALCQEIDGAQIAYVQSDEISVLIHYYKRFNSQPWFGNVLQKIASVSAGIASGVMTEYSHGVFGSTRRACFDARVFTLPESEVANYFVWRQRDWKRNSVQMLAQSLFSAKECHKKNNSQLQEMCFERGFNWNNLETRKKRGRCIVREEEDVLTEDGIVTVKDWAVHFEIPDFAKDRAYIERHLELVEE